MAEDRLPKAAEEPSPANGSGKQRFFFSKPYEYVDYLLYAGLSLDLLKFYGI